ncbi:hypothetical protein AT727_19025 [Desulfitobacterium hafniense]|uniref:Uncharacterized protein n=1 Tax=Desulfitobacterium hafniense TaxID=49338 RepID=A0A0W1JLG1_DESHA|nr:hypothetical protein [Desulfitobacterium hafniense]KTE92448.1 hypothetical protein AT727_19025 [Desulfitobacterium hafniense]
MVKRFVISFMVLLFLLFLSVSPGYAENSPPLGIMQLSAHVLPEYDTSDVLIIYGIQFSNNSQSDYTGEVRFAVPKGITKPIVIEDTPQATGSDIHIQVRVEDKGEYDEIVWNPTTPIKAMENYPIHLEYYFNPLPGTGQKKFTYTLYSNFDIGQVQVNVFEPLKATEFKMEPAGKFLKKDSEGLNIYSIDPSPLSKGQNLNVEISYIKTDPEPSITPLSATQNAGSSVKQNGSLSSAAVLLPMVGMLALVIVISIKSFNTPSAKETPTQRPKKSIQGNQEQTSSDRIESLYAHEKRKLRQKLLDGEINEETYREILADIERDYN